MIYITKFISLSILIFSFLGCSEKITYSGKIITEDSFDINNLNTKNDIIEKLGSRSYIDPIEKKYYYFSERKNTKNFFKQKITNRTMVVFIFNENETIKLVSHYDLNDEKDIQYIKDKTPYELIERGLIKKIFGGIGGTVPSTIE